MKTHKLHIASLIVCLANLSSTAFAAAKQPTGVLYVPQSAIRVFEVIHKYSAYSKSEGAAYTMLGLPMLTMSESKVVSSSSFEEALKTQAKIFVALQPANLGSEQAGLYPRFTMNCVSPSPGAPANSMTAFTHHCDSTPDNHFAVDAFSSDIEVQEIKDGEHAGQTKIAYIVDMKGNPAEIQAISAAVAEKLGVASTGVQKLFEDPTAFFTLYYKNFYKGWVKSL